MVLIGYLANLIPVPGGFGVLEGGLAGALIVYGAPATQAAAAVIVYHAIAFWVPSLGGLVGYALLNRRASCTDATDRQLGRLLAPQCSHADRRLRIVGGAVASGLKRNEIAARLGSAGVVNDTMVVCQ